MKTKIVLWGANAQDERVLIAMELLADTNKVMTYAFPEAIVTDEFYQKMMDEWRDGNAADFPEGFTTYEQELTISDSLLPEEIKVERTDLIQRAQTEWHFVILSAKLYESYQSELAEIKMEVEKLENFDANIWDRLKEYWDKVQNQVREKNLFKEQADALKDITNQLFEHLKSLRKKLDDQFHNLSKENLEKAFAAVQEIDQKMEKGIRFQHIFDDLKNLQKSLKDWDFTREHRNKALARLDAAFKAAKEKRFGSSAVQSSESGNDHLSRRFTGLLSAIEKMEQSIQRDQRDLDFENRKIANTDGQLEAQIRQAKIKMIEARAASKQEKLDEMLQTRVQLEKKLEEAKEREQKKQERQLIEDAKRAAQEKIANEIKAAEQARGDEVMKLEKAAEAILESKAKQPKIEVTSPAPAEMEPVLAEIKVTPFEQPEQEMTEIAESVSAGIEEAVQYVEETAALLEDPAIVSGDAEVTGEDPAA